MSKLLPCSLYGSIHFLQFLNAWSCSPITLFKVLQIWIIILIVIKIIKNSNLLYKDRVYFRNQEQHDVTEKDTVDTTIFKKILRHIFNKINRCIVQKSGPVVAYNSPWRFFLWIGWKVLVIFRYIIINE